MCFNAVFTKHLVHITQGKLLSSNEVNLISKSQKIKNRKKGHPSFERWYAPFHSSHGGVEESHLEQKVGAEIGESASGLSEFLLRLLTDGSSSLRRRVSVHRTEAVC